MGSIIAGENVSVKTIIEEVKRMKVSACKISVTDICIGRELSGCESLVIEFEKE